LNLLKEKTSLKKLLSNILSTTTGIYSIAVKNLTTSQQLTITPVRLRSASLIKIFIMIEAFRQADLGQLNLAEEQLILAADQVGGAGPLEVVPPGTKQTWYQLIELMITESDNTATNILINKISQGAINATIRSLGCHDTTLQRKMMDFTSAEQGLENYTSVTDITSVLEKLYFHRCLSPKRDQEMLNILKNQQDRCKIPQGLPEEIIVANKTGELDGVEHDAGIVYHPDNPFIITIMTEALPDAIKGQAIIAELTKTVYHNLHTMD